MKQRIVTLCWGTAWDRYGRTFIDSFERHWPSDVELYLVTDKKRDAGRAVQIPLAEVPGYIGFMSKYGDDPKAQGRLSRSQKARRGERFWKHDAVKWCAQGLAPRVALDGLEDGDILAWFDADVVTTSDVPSDWLEALLDGHDVACLQRRPYHTEIGGWVVRINDGTRRFVERQSQIYSSGDVFELREYHSAYVFDAALGDQPRLNVRNLNKAGVRGHPWPYSPLAAHTDHKKGKLKDA